MKKLFILFLFFTFDLSSQDCSEFFLIRHAEKDRTDPKNKNPNLNEKGKVRALKWVEVFKNLEFDKILCRYQKKLKRKYQSTALLKLIMTNFYRITIIIKF